ncbi:PEP-CTERM sorting domain-containing protein [Pseudodesulfovibrio methanolicus]|uniref:PEP-CTERM sorting domain-containing protein n=1 Tax=Pseudodesulfovibrio methanolicus TaxID=3126690 RepID=A0ABZ2ISH2_9BACT
MDTLSANLFSFNFEGIDTLVLSASGGTDYAANEGGAGALLVMDDFTYNEPVATPAPEPPTVALLPAGFTGLAGFGLLKRRRG